MTADFDDEESIKEVLKDAYGAFLVTNFWEHKDVDREIQQVHFHLNDILNRFYHRRLSVSSSNIC